MQRRGLIWDDETGVCEMVGKVLTSAGIEAMTLTKSIDDQTSSLHVTLHFLAFAGSCGLRAPTLLNARCAVRCDGKQPCCREKPELRRQRGSARFSFQFPGYLVTVKLHADAELPPRRINGIDAYDVARAQPFRCWFAGNFLGHLQKNFH